MRSSACIKAVSGFVTLIRWTHLGLHNSGVILPQRRENGKITITFRRAATSSSTVPSCHMREYGTGRWDALQSCRENLTQLATRPGSLYTVAVEGPLQQQNTGEAHRKMTHQRLFWFEHPHRRSFLYVVCVRVSICWGVCRRNCCVKYDAYSDLLFHVFGTKEKIDFFCFCFCFFFFLSQLEEELWIFFFFFFGCICVSNWWVSSRGI